MRQDNPVEVVRAWQDAVNRKDADRLVALSDQDIELVGPRGSARGSAVLRDWLERAGLSLAARRVYARDNAVVVEGRGTWRSAATGGEASEADVALVFRVFGGRVASFERRDRLDEALEAGGLTETDEVVA